MMKNLNHLFKKKILMLNKNQYVPIVIIQIQKYKFVYKKETKQ